MVYIDFMPNPTGDYDGQYDSFRSLIDRANNWLERNTTMEVISCETITVRAEAHATAFNSELMICPCFHVENTVGNHRIGKEPELHGLRLWYLGHEDTDTPQQPVIINNQKPEKKSKKEKKNESGVLQVQLDTDTRSEAAIRTSEDNVLQPQQIGYTTLVPRPGVGTKAEVNGYLSNPQKVYEPIAATVGRHNEELKTDPLVGHILNVQTIRVPYDKDEGHADPEETYHHPGDTEMQAVRIYYNHGKNHKLREKIGFADFMPSQNGGETFTHIFGLADEWLHQQSNLRVCHIQTIFCNLLEGTRLYIDTQRPLIDVKFGITLVRAVRVWYLRPHPDEQVRFPKMPTLKFLTYEPIMKRIEEDIIIQKKVKTKSGKTKIKKIKQTKVEVQPMDSMLVVAKKAVADLKDKRIGILGVETDTAYVNEQGVGTCETMRITTDMKMKRAIRFYTFDVPKGVILAPSSGRNLDNNTSETCTIL